MDLGGAEKTKWAYLPLIDHDGQREPGGLAQEYRHISQRSSEGFTRESAFQI
jgi:hypothetical protein